jgi:hypothetical protein
LSWIGKHSTAVVVEDCFASEVAVEPCWQNELFAQGSSEELGQFHRPSFML